MGYLSQAPSSLHLERLRSHLEALWLLCPLLKGDENWTLSIPARFLLDRASVIFYSEHPCWITCQDRAQLEPCAGTRRRVSTSLKRSPAGRLGRPIVAAPGAGSLWLGRASVGVQRA